MSAIWESANWTRQFGIRQTGNRQFGMLPSIYVFPISTNCMLPIIISIAKSAIGRAVVLIIICVDTFFKPEVIALSVPS